MTPVSAAEIVPILTARVAEAMFPLSNLRRHGEAGHPRAMRFYRQGDAVLGLTEDGVAMPLFPPGSAPTGIGTALAGTRLRGVIGPAACVRAVLQGCGIGEGSMREVEPQFDLTLSDLVMPAGAGSLTGLRGHHALAVQGRAAFEDELGVPSGEPVTRLIDRWIAEDTHRMWLVDGAPVALTGVNASLPGIVQVGGVYVPPALRGRGYARQAVAAHLVELRGRGVERATLCAASAAAAKSYAALGFRRIGDYSITIFPEPQEIAS